jgi:GTPase SAR1 family protein
MWDENLTYMGMRDIWGGEHLFGLSPTARSHHLYVIGQTGTGKSTLLRNLITQDLERGHGVGLIDPHGDLAHEILDCVPPHRTDHVVYFNPADRNYPIGLNVLDPTNDGHLIASSIVGTLKGIWRDSWGPRMEYILYATIVALTECENVTLLSVQRMLSDPVYRKWVVRQVRDPTVRAFWEKEFAGYDRRFLAEVIAPVQNKIGQLVMTPAIRNILGQVRSTIDIPYIMNNGRILIANLSKGKLGGDKANLLGSLLVTQFQLAALGRAERSSRKRRPFHLYVDEFPNFVTDSFTSILSESRKYALSLTLASQFTAQMPPDIRDAIFGNVGTIVCFRIGAEDAEILSRQFGDEILPSALTALANHEVRVKLLSHDGSPQIFRGRSLSPLNVRSGRRHIVMRRSRERFAIKREIIESKIRRWMGEDEKRRPDNRKTRRGTSENNSPINTSRRKNSRTLRGESEQNKLFRRGGVSPEPRREPGRSRGERK